MKLKELWMVSPQSFIFVRNEDGRVIEYKGTKDLASRTVEKATATSYPMYKSVIEVELKAEAKKPVSDAWAKQKAYLARRAEEIGAEMDKAIEDGDWDRFSEKFTEANGFMNASQKGVYFKKFVSARRAQKGEQR